MQLLGARLPIDLGQLGFPDPARFGATVLASGRVGWAWDEPAPGFGIGSFSPPEATDVAGWGMDHIVLLVPEIEEAVAELRRCGADLRLRTTVRERPTAFFRVGTLLEVIQVGVEVPGIYGVALETEEPLEEVAERWRQDGFDVSDPRAAIQPGRRILTVRGLEAGLAAMTPDR